jgi:hypothetical protein
MKLKAQMNLEENVAGANRMNSRTTDGYINNSEAGGFLGILYIFILL